MSERRRRRYSFQEVRYSEILTENRQPEAYRLHKPERQTLVIRTTYRRRRDPIERPPTPPPRRSSRKRSVSPPRRLPSPLLSSSRIMSPTDSPKEGSKKWVPLPPRVLTKEEEERAKRDAKKDSKKTQGEIKGHKPRPSADSGFASATPYYEERSPDQYSPKSTKPQRRSADIQYYEQVNSKPRPIKHRDREDGHVRVVSADSAVDDEPKTQALEKTHTALQIALADTARHNYEAARDQEAKYQNAAARIRALEEELKRLTLQAQITEAKLAESDRQRVAAERKIREQEIGKELELWREKQRFREEEFDRRQNDEIENSPSPIGRGRRPPLVDQPKPPRRSSTLVTTNPFTNVLDEARADYEIKKHYSTDTRRTERPRDDKRYK